MIIKSIIYASLHCLYAFIFAPRKLYCINISGAQRLTKKKVAKVFKNSEFIQSALDHKDADKQSAINKS